MSGHMLKRFLVSAIVVLMLSGCSMNPYVVDGGVSLPDHSHAAPQSDNVVVHDPVGYCGNTVTTVRCQRVGKQEENWERSFWGGNSVELTDFLRWLHYSGDICRCLPEYYVETEFSESEYGISLTGGYVRYEGKQCQLNGDQLAWLTETLAKIEDGTGKDLCALPPAEKPVYANLEE